MGTNFHQGKFTLIALAGFLFIQAFSCLAQDGELLFKSHCAACHSIGKGKLVGPDLVGISEKRSFDWQVSFIRSSQNLISSGDADAVAIAKEYYNMLMPDFSGTDEEIKAIIHFLDKSSGLQESVSESVKDTVKIYPGNIDTGRMYMEGSLTFNNKGASCIACHHVNFTGAKQGGLLAKELTSSYKTSGGDAGLNAIIDNSPFPSMKIAYQNNTITPQEIAHITAYLKASSETNTGLTTVLFTDTIIIALFLAAFLLFIIGALYSKRKKESVNRAVMARQSRF